jgi:DNA repair photolyase
MRLIYEPGGRAREYAPLAVNLYQGCDHGCLYCYVPGARHITREDFQGSRPRFCLEDTLRWLARDLETLQKAGDEREVLMSFSCDPYCRADCDCLLTRDAIQLFIHYGRRFALLTKAGMESTRDFDLLKTYPLCLYGTTLTLWEPERTHWEPHAASTEERIRALALAHKLGIRTFASLEPLINLSHSLDIIQATLEYVDQYRLGKLNHYRLPYEIDHAAYLRDAVAILEEAGKPYLIKDDLRRAAGVGP